MECNSSLFKQGITAKKHCEFGTAMDFHGALQHKRRSIQYSREDRHDQAN